MSKDKFNEYGKKVIEEHISLLDQRRKKVIKLAKKVEKQSNIYKKQLFDCKNSLNKKKYIIF